MAFDSPPNDTTKIKNDMKNIAADTTRKIDVSDTSKYRSYVVDGVPVYVENPEYSHQIKVNRNKTAPLMPEGNIGLKINDEDSRNEINLKSGEVNVSGNHTHIDSGTHVRELLLPKTSRNNVTLNGDVTVEANNKAPLVQVLTIGAEILFIGAVEQAFIAKSSTAHMKNAGVLFGFGTFLGIGRSATGLNDESIATKTNNKFYVNGEHNSLELNRGQNNIYLTDSSSLAVRKISQKDSIIVNSTGFDKDSLKAVVTLDEEKHTILTIIGKKGDTNITLSQVNLDYNRELPHIIEGEFKTNDNQVSIKENTLKILAIEDKRGFVKKLATEESLKNKTGAPGSRAF